MGINMADLQTELKKLTNLRFDDDDSDQAVNNPAVTVNAGGVVFNMTRAAFEYVKAHPGSTAAEVTATVGRDAGSRLISLFNRNQVRRVESDNGYRYYAVADEYKVTPNSEVLAKAHAARKEQARKLREKRQKKLAKLAATAAAEAQAAPQAATTTQLPLTDVQRVLQSLPVATARELYDELKKIFGA